MHEKHYKVEKSTMEIEAERARRYEAHLSVLLINVDDLGKINEKYGKQAGDYVLSSLSDLIRSNIRKIDVFGRWSPDDFIILTVDRNEGGSRALGEKLRKLVNETPIIWGDKVIPVSVSIGLAYGTPGAEGEIDELIQLARNAIMKAKSEGKNCVAVWDRRGWANSQ